MLVGEKLCKTYNGRDVLQDVDITIEPGQITSLIGPSGSGKTTLLRVLSMLELPDTGSITLGDCEFQFPTKSEPATPWPRISVVFQQLFLWPHLTLRENILLPLKGATTSEHLDELIELFQMHEFIDRYPNEASLGQRQRVALARALISNPEYLILDEVTSALDVEQVGVVLGHLQTLKKKGVGILLVTHLLNFARRASDQIVFMDKGSVLEYGGTDLLENSEHPRIQKFLSTVASAS